MEVLFHLIVWLFIIGISSIYIVLKFDKNMTIKELIKIKNNKTSKDE